MAMVPMSLCSGDGSEPVVFFDMGLDSHRRRGHDSSWPARGVGDYVAGVTARAMNGELDFECALRERVKLLRGLPTQKALEVAGSIPLMPGAEKLMKELKSLGFRTVLISGGFTIIAQRVAEQLHMDAYYANELVVDDGVLTGDVRGPLTRQSSKKEVLEEICNKLNISPCECVAVGDGSNDLCWKGVVGTFIAFNAKPVVQSAADVVVDGKNMESLIPIIKEEYIRHAKRTARKENKIS